MRIQLTEARVQVNKLTASWNIVFITSITCVYLNILLNNHDLKSTVTFGAWLKFPGSTVIGQFDLVNQIISFLE